MKSIAETFTLAKSSTMENAAIESIYDFWVDQSENQTKSPDETLILIINTIADACKVVPIENKTADSDDLMDVRRYLEDIEAQLKGLKPSTITIANACWDSCLEALEEIGNQAAKDGALVVKSRLDYFIRTLRKKVTEQIALEEKAEKFELGKRIFFVIVCIIAVIYTIVNAINSPLFR